MPLYEYLCESCGRTLEAIQSYSEPLLTICDRCGGPLHKLLSAPAVQFKGSGWYVSDYGKAGSGPRKHEAGEGSAESKGDSKSDSKSDAKGDSKSDSRGDSKSGDSKSGDAGSGDSKAASGTEKSSESRAESKPEAKPASKPEASAKKPDAA